MEQTSVEQLPPQQRPQQPSQQPHRTPEPTPSGMAATKPTPLRKMPSIERGWISIKVMAAGRDLRIACRWRSASVSASGAVSCKLSLSARAYTLASITWAALSHDDWKAAPEGAPAGVSTPTGWHAHTAAGYGCRLAAAPWRASGKRKVQTIVIM